MTKLHGKDIEQNAIMKDKDKLMKSKGSGVIFSGPDTYVIIMIHLYYDWVIGERQWSCCGILIERSNIRCHVGLP